MNNFKIAFTRFIQNRNTVTIIGMVLIIGLLYYGYSSQVNAAINYVQVPVAKKEIQPRTLIDSDMITTINVPAIAVDKTVLKSRTLIVGKYTNVNSVIPKGSMIYPSQITTKENLPDSAFVEVPNGMIPYQFSVTMNTTYGNSIFPGNKIDIYMKAVEDDTNKVMVGKLLENVEVLAVKDSQGRHVFEDSSEDRTPANLIFGVPSDIHILLRKAEYMGNGVVLFPVPHGGTVAEEEKGDIQVSTQYLKDFINSHTVVIPDEEIEIEHIEPTPEVIVPTE